MTLAREFKAYKDDAETTIKEASAGQGKALKGAYPITVTTNASINPNISPY